MDEEDSLSPERRRRPSAPPKVTAGQREEADAELEPNPCSGTALDLTESLGIALNRVAMGKAAGQDILGLRKRRERQQREFPDTPGYEMLNRVVVPAERELVRGYNGLVEKGLVPLAAAGVFIDGAMADLQGISDQGISWMKNIDDITDQLGRIVSSFDALSFRGGEQSVDLAALQEFEQKMPELKEQLKGIKEQVCRADVLVRAAEEGPKVGLKHAAKARELAAEADARDSEAISRAKGGRGPGMSGDDLKRSADAMDCPSGNCRSKGAARLGGSSGRTAKRAPAGMESVEGRSGPVIADGAEKLERASEQTEAARKETELVSHPTRGKIMKAVAALDKAADLAMAASGSGPSGGAKGGRGGGGCASCAEGCSSASESLAELRQRYANTQDEDEKAAIRAEAHAIVAKTAESYRSLKDEVKAARNSAEKAKGKLADAAQSWEDIVQSRLGVRDKGTLNEKLPRLPEPDANVSAPRKGQASWDATSKPRTQPTRSADSEGAADIEEEGEEYEEPPRVAPKPKKRATRSRAPDRGNDINMDADAQFRRMILRPARGVSDSEE